ncbi:MAG: hypothetical protein ACR2RV_15595 [Verrucomicrobiales bacterium]
MRMTPISYDSAIAALICLAAAVSLCLPACQSILPYKTGGLPSDIKPGASKRGVYRKMGWPERRGDWVDSGRKIGEIWYYEDYWWAKDNWAQKFGSWNVYFDNQERFVGWKLVSPRPQEPDAREVFYELD